MIKITEKMISDARDLMAKGTLAALGYRLVVKTIGAISDMEAFEKEKYSTLAKAGFETKTTEQKEREDRGTQYGIIVSVGGGAFKGAHLGGTNWAKEGDVVLFDRYAGVVMEVPPGSKDLYRLMNDESLLCKMVEK